MLTADCHCPARYNARMRSCALLLLVPVLLFAQAAEVEITAEPHHRLAFANDQVRVFSVEVAPHSATLMHRHLHDYIYVTLGAADISNEVSGQPAAELKLADGETRFSPGPFAHLVRDLAEQPFRNVTVELLQDDKLRHSTPHWTEDRGLEILHGGTQEILFVKDGVRASEFDLQPGGKAPMRHRRVPARRRQRSQSKGRRPSEKCSAQRLGPLLRLSKVRLLLLVPRRRSPRSDQLRRTARQVRDPGIPVILMGGQFGLMWGGHSCPPPPRWPSCPNQTGKLSLPAISPLRSSPLLWYKQCTESSSVASRAYCLQLSSRVRHLKK